jgi:transposase
MSSEKLSMRKVREILRQKLVLKRSHREVATSAGVSVGVVSKVVNRAEAAGIDWATACALDDDALDVKLYGPRLPSTATRPAPDFVWLHTERKRPGVTLELLHIEYLEDHPDGYRYSQFCGLYRDWTKSHRLSMRQVHVAGEKVFVDYSGRRPHIKDAKTGELVPVELFVAVLGASNFTYAEATRSQKGVDFIQSHVRTFEFIGGVPAITTPDQLKSGVTTSCWYDPQIQRTYEEMATHYGTSVLPARPKRPRDKAKVEAAVQIVQRWILARMRNEVFFSIEELNARIGVLVDELNARPMRMYGGKTRAQLFAETDKKELKPLPSERFVYAEWKKATVNIDYHIDVDKHFYSVPHHLVHEVVEARSTATMVEVVLRNTLVTSHVRSYVAGKHTTKPEHMPKAHREAIEWPPSRLISWAGKFGPKTAQLVTELLDEYTHPEHGYRSCLGILRLGKRYGDDRLEAACARALAAGARRYRHIESILKNNLDKVPLAEVTDENNAPVMHENVRGPNYYN